MSGLWCSDDACGAAGVGSEINETLPRGLNIVTVTDIVRVAVGAMNYKIGYVIK